MAKMQPAETITPQDLLAYRDKHGMSQKDLAAAMGINEYVTIWRLETGRSPVTRLIELAFLAVVAKLNHKPPKLDWRLP